MRASLCLLAGLAAAPAARAAPVEEAWLEQLYQRAAADLRAGRPLVVEAHVALCDNRIIPCGSARLGDGDSLETNLYWATTGGLRGWFERRGSGWTRVARRAGDRPAILEEIVWRRRVEPGPAWQRRGVTRPFDVYVVGHAWRGGAIDDAVEAWVADLYGGHARAVPAGAVALDGGPAAHVVAYIGHNRLMDREPYDWRAAERRGEPSPPKGTIAVACASAPYLARAVSSPARVPLLMTADLLFAGSHSFEGAVAAFSRGEGLAEIRLGASRAYAGGEDKPLKRVQTLFTNPSDRRWSHF